MIELSYFELACWLGTTALLIATAYMRGKGKAAKITNEIVAELLKSFREMKSQ